jgi:hypothetical protein
MADSPAEIRTWELGNKNEKRYDLAEFSRFRIVFVNILSAVTVTRIEPSNSEYEMLGNFLDSCLQHAA